MQDEPHTELPSLEIDFCGLKCESPFFLASSAVCTNYEMVARAFDMGWAGVFYKTICLQEIREVSPRFDAVGNPFVGFRNMEQLSENPAEVDFDILHRLKQHYPSKIVVASIMGQTEEQWIELAHMAEAAGCDAVELNFSCPQMRLTGMGSDVGQNPELVTFYTSYVKRAVKIPVIPKMTPNITKMDQPAMGAYFAGANAISAINTIKSITMSHDAEVSQQHTISGYSGRAVKPIAQRFIVEMAQNPVIKNIEYSGIGGIETWRDALEFIQLGCRNVQVCTSRHCATGRHGGRAPRPIRDALRARPRHHCLSPHRPRTLHRLRALRNIVCRRRTSGHQLRQGRAKATHRGKQVCGLPPVPPRVPHRRHRAVETREEETASVIVSKGHTIHRNRNH